VCIEAREIVAVADRAFVRVMLAGTQSLPRHGESP
jgi:hypothetical protein